MLITRTNYILITNLNTPQLITLSYATSFVKNKPNVSIVQKFSYLGLKYNSTRGTTSYIRKMMNKYRTSASPILEPSLEMNDESNRSEQAVPERWNVQEETLFDVSKEETSSTFQNIFSYESDVSPLCSSEDETAPEGMDDPVITKDGTPYNESGRQLLSSAVVSNDTVCHFSLPSNSRWHSESIPRLTHSPHQGSEGQLVPNISSTADGNSSEFSTTSSRAKILVNLFLREMSAWSEPPPRVRLSSEYESDEDIFAELKGNSNEKRCWGKVRASFKRLRISSDPEYIKRKREYEVLKKHDKEERFQGIASLDDTTRQLLEVDIVKPLSMFQPTSEE